ncbi:hypothetical protein VTJ04DRAFT_1470 [Mycothermus thermophilus]|uniref:uncharacterized protein n=1 Tax=Humicola insolens TaxID=85995 RepID=UPI0037427188
MLCVRSSSKSGEQRVTGSGYRTFVSCVTRSGNTVTGLKELAFSNPSTQPLPGKKKGADHCANLHHQSNLSTFVPSSILLSRNLGRVQRSMVVCMYTVQHNIQSFQLPAQQSMDKDTPKSPQRKKQ